MTRRMAALGAVLGLGGVLLLAASCGGSSSAASPSSPPKASATSTTAILGAQIQPAVAKPDVTLTDISGKPFSLKKDTAGYLTLVYLGYTHCPDVCPTTMNDFAEAIKTLPPDVASHVKMIFITTDPERDTPEVLKTWLSHFNPQFIGLTGTQDQLNQLQDKLLMPRAEKEDDGHGGYGVSHGAFTFAFTANDDLAHTVYPEGFTPQDIAHDLVLLQKNGWKS